MSYVGLVSTGAGQMLYEQVLAEAITNYGSRAYVTVTAAVDRDLSGVATGHSRRDADGMPRGATFW